MADPSIIIDAEPDWKDTPEVSYAFSTVVQANPYFKEQRRPMYPSVIRGLRCTFTLETENAQRVLNRLISGAPQVCCVPIYSEPLFADAITQGATLLTLQTDLSFLWNAQNSSYFILLDYTTGASEMLKVASISGQAVTLSVPIAGVWVAARTVIYPAMASVVKDVKANNITSRVTAFDAQFDEVTIGEEAVPEQILINTGDGVLVPPALVPRVCPEDLYSSSPIYSAYFDSTKWTPTGGLATWITDHWESVGGKLYLTAIGSWPSTLIPRPYFMRVTIGEPPGSSRLQFRVYDLEMEGDPAGLLAYSTNYSYFRIYGYVATGDVYRLEIENLDDSVDFTITNIEFENV